MYKKLFYFILIAILLIGLIFLSIRLGGLQVSFKSLVRGLFIEYDENVMIIFDLRFPRIIIALLSGAALAVSGVLFQAVLRNPLADPGIIGISSAASFAALAVTAFFPQFFFYIPIFAFVGGFIACALVYLLSWKSGLNPLRIILVGVAINAVFTGLMEAMQYMSGGNQSGVAAIINANISMKTWEDVCMLVGYAVIGLIAAICISGKCNLLLLEDKTIRNLGVNVNGIRLIVSLIAVLLASIVTAVAGVISFVGLIAPHIARLLVGSNHKVLIPFSVFLGSFIVLFADTVGRTIAYPHEIPGAIIMAVAGGPFFIFLLRRSDKTYGS